MMAKCAVSMREKVVRIARAWARKLLEGTNAMLRPAQRRPREMRLEEIVEEGPNVQGWVGESLFQRTIARIMRRCAHLPRIRLSSEYSVHAALGPGVTSCGFAGNLATYIASRAGDCA